jgi:hypothetical protein
MTSIAVEPNAFRAWMAPKGRGNPVLRQAALSGDTRPSARPESEAR